jgi:hypothetical protein
MLLHIFAAGMTQQFRFVPMVTILQHSPASGLAFPVTETEMAPRVNRGAIVHLEKSAD